MALFGTPGRGDRIAKWVLFPLLLVFAALVLVLWVLHFPLQIEGDSMFPSIHQGDRALVTRGYTTPATGDVVVVLASPRPGDPLRDMVKRVVALPGQTVEIDRGVATVDGVTESPDPRITLSNADVSLRSYVVPEGHIYVLGDNRPESLDSRFYGPVPMERVKGRVTFVFTPITRFGRVD